MKEPQEIEKLYADVVAMIKTSGKRLVARSGNIQDIGVLKLHLTEEDIRIERELTALITSRFPRHKVFAEEEHNIFEQADDVWVIDPISGTAAFIAGIPHYGLVATHVRNGRPQFCVVYDPSADELFTARKGKGAFANSKHLQVSSTKDRVLFNLSLPAIHRTDTEELWHKLIKLNVYRNSSSFAVNYCWVAAGRYDGVISLAKDSFPEYAGWLMIQEAGGTFTNHLGNSIQPEDRVFVGGNKATHAALQQLLQS